MLRLGDRPTPGRGYDRSRADQLGKIDLPVLVLHGSRDTFIDQCRGPQVAVIPGARDVEIEAVGHDYPPPV